MKKKFLYIQSFWKLEALSHKLVISLLDIYVTKNIKILKLFGSLYYDGSGYLDVLEKCMSQLDIFPC